MAGSSKSFDERKLALEEQRFAFEKRKWTAEQQVQRADWHLPWKNPLLIAILTAAAAAGGNAVVSLVNANSQVRLERLRGEQALITEMIKTGGDGETTAKNLRFLVETGLISDEQRRKELSAYLDTREATPSLLPSLPSDGSLPASAAARAEGLTVSETCKEQGASGRLCVENGILISPAGKPFDLVDGTRRTDALKSPPQAIILHYSAGPDGGSKAAFKSPTSPGSVHLEINRDGSITQLVPFDIAANHAGMSDWNGLKTLNTTTIGVSFANWGRLTGGPGNWRNFSGSPVADRDVLVHRDAETGAVSGWERYAAAQLSAADQVIEALIRAYPSIRGIVGHSEVSVPRGRKLDPGPALPIDRFRKMVPASS